MGQHRPDSTDHVKGQHNMEQQGPLKTIKFMLSKQYTL